MSIKSLRNRLFAFLLIMSMLWMLFEVAGVATGNPLNSILSENFDSVTPPNLPAGWTVENTNGDSYTWETVSWVGMAHTPPNSMKIMYSPIAAMNDWFFSPQISLTGGATYRLTFYYKAGASNLPEYLEVKYGTSATSVAMTTPLIDLPHITNTDFQQASVDFTPSTTAGYYLGFHAYSPAGTWFIFVDTIVLDTASAPTYSISGHVTDSSNNAISGVTISDGAGHTATTDSNGNYSLSGLAAGSYTITPSKSNYTFRPSTLTVSVPPRKTGQDFLGAVPQPTSAVPFFSQRDPRWINYPLRTNGACSADCSTIGACGCTLTSATMVFAYYGSNLTPPGLSDCMGNSACPFAWGTGASCSNGLATYVGQSAFSWSRLDQELNQNHRPVILGTHKAGNPQNTHWVVVVEGQGNNASDYYINDPWFPPPQGGAHIKLSTMAIRNAVFDWLSVYSGQPNPISSSSAIVRLSPNRPNILSPSQILTVTGTATIYTMTDLTMTVQLVAQSSAGNITDMMVWTDTTPSNTWQPFASLIILPVTDNVYARFRDEFGNVSDPSSDTTYPVKSPVSPPAQIFLPLITR